MTDYNKDLFDLFSQKSTDSEEHIYSVSEITGEIKSLLTSNFGTEPFWIKGEISNFRGRNAQGHIYFRLKDEKAVINLAYFKYANKRLSFDLEEGMQVSAFGKISLYEPHGSYQFIVEKIKPGGIGDLFIKFEKLKKKLEAQGLFEEERKKELPYLPENIGIITSPTGAALQDMIKIIKNRLPSTNITIFPARVQGDQAKHDIVEALKLANQKKFKVDVIILGRGGGSIEELWAFNEEVVATAISKSKLPVISAVGHESDFTISDFIADVRASTPSNAAERVVPDHEDLKARIDFLIFEIVSSIRENVSLYSERIRGLARSSVLRDPMVLIRDRQQTLDNLLERGVSALKIRIERSLNKFSGFRKEFAGTLKLLLKSYDGKVKILSSTLKALNPKGILERGYSIAKDASGNIVKNSKSVNLNDVISITLSKGSLRTTVKSKGENNTDDK